MRNHREGFVYSIVNFACTIALTTRCVVGKPRTMGRPKQFDERIQLTLVEGTTGRIDVLLRDREYRLDFIRTAIEAEIEKRSQDLPARKRRQRSLEALLSAANPKKQ